METDSEIEARGEGARDGPMTTEPPPSPGRAGGGPVATHKQRSPERVGRQRAAKGRENLTR